ncbi:hypothetical protein GOARA_061_00800 [Gordonia araii NBRC 100433]|uniref:Type VII secretion protein EccB n=1 Tax=Gordonia araii NBRC 100433 TaxID=1073574 RepID=G7H466_9ACTN|nr:type VII secretion protein EccB [Gordonia araii]NNG96296.1 type VII secretion protein EccB [Gordonia araii NBRC 100433]GAB10641.1 hypothetical protein GOARA_061_00800 [Gordonia araii NBRC 100433]
MVRQLTTRAQVSGYRFLLQRAEHMLVRRDARMLHDPMRAQRQSITVGLVLAVLIAAGSGVYGLIRPVGSVADAPIVLNRSDGGLFVVVDRTAHPALNLASARLIVGEAATPKTVSAAALRDLPRGPTLGIIGAPNALGTGAATAWTVCDAAESGVSADVAGDRAEPPARTAVVVGDGSEAAGLRAAENAGMVAAVGGEVYLVYRLGSGMAARTVRARVDTSSSAVRRALRLDDAPVRGLSSGMANAIEEVEPLTVPTIPESGRPGALGLAAGTVFAVPGLDGRADHFVALADGVQRLTGTAAEMLRFAAASSPTQIPTVSPARAATAPIVERVRVEHFPDRAPHLLDAVQAPVVCQHWHRRPGAPAATTALLAGHRIPGGRPVIPVGADGPGPGLDEVRVAPGTTSDVRATGMDPRSSRRHGRFLVSDTGIRYSVADDRAAAVLGLGDPGLAPWPIVGLLPAGPELSRAQALVAHGRFDQ